MVKCTSGREYTELEAEASFVKTGEIMVGIVQEAQFFGNGSNGSCDKTEGENRWRVLNI